MHWRGRYTLLLLANWSSNVGTQDRQVSAFDILPSDEHMALLQGSVLHIIDLWTGRYHRKSVSSVQNEQIIARNVPCLGACLLSLHVSPPDEPRFLGSDLHAGGGAAELQCLSFCRSESAATCDCPDGESSNSKSTASACAVLSLNRDDVGKVFFYLPGSSAPPRVFGDAAIGEHAPECIGDHAWAIPARVSEAGPTWLLLEWR